jgi:S-adenosylmethionine uptake transporter
MSAAAAPAPTAPRSRLGGPLVLAILGIAALCGMDGIIKHLERTDEVLFVTWGRYLSASAFALVVWLRAGRPRVTREMARVHALRGVIVTGCALTFFWGIHVLPLAEAVTLSFIAPLVVPFVARAALGEALRPTSLGAGALGFVGVLVALSGEPAAQAGEHHTLGAIAVLASATLYAGSLTLLRARSGKDGPAVVSLLGAAYPTLILAVPALVLAERPAPSQLPWYALLGLLGALGTYLLSAAYARAEAQQLAPSEFTALGWSWLVGWLVFDETPRGQIWVGAAIIVAACGLAAWDEWRARTSREG